MKHTWSVHQSWLMFPKYISLVIFTAKTWAFIVEDIVPVVPYFHPAKFQDLFMIVNLLQGAWYFEDSLAHYVYTSALFTNMLMMNRDILLWMFCHLSVHPTALHTIMFDMSCSYLVQLLTLVTAWTLLTRGPFFPSGIWSSPSLPICSPQYVTNHNHHILYSYWFNKSMKLIDYGVSMLTF